MTSQQSDGATTPNASGEATHSQANQSNRKFYFIIALMVAAWALVLVLRPAVQSRYFAWQLMREQSKADAYRHYFERMVSLKDSGVPGAVMLIESDDPRHRAMGAQVLRFASPDAGRALLIECLADRDESVRRAAAMSLARDDSEAVVRAFVEMTGSKDGAVAALGAGMLGRLGGDAAAVALRTVLDNDPPVQVKAEAIDGLGQMHDRASADAILAALDDERPLEQPVEFDRLAAEALGQVSPKLMGTLPAGASATGMLEVPTTVSEVAARAMQRIAGVDVEFRAGMSAGERQAVVERFRAGLGGDAPADN